MMVVLLGHLGYCVLCHCCLRELYVCVCVCVCGCEGKWVCVSVVTWIIFTDIKSRHYEVRL